MWQGWVTAILGIWLALAPLISMDVPSVQLNNVFLGILAAVVSGDAPNEKVRVRWVGLGAGVWLAFSTFFRFFAVGDGYRWSNVISGFLILTSGCSALARPETEKYA